MQSENYAQFEAGNQVTYAAFEEYLDTLPFPDLDRGHISQRMVDLMIDCHLSAAHNLDPKKRPGCKLEVVGFDFLIDEDFRVWLIEVNTCPFIGPVLVSEQPNFMLDLIDDTFKLTIDKYFFGKELTQKEIETETKYQLICNLDGSISKRSKLGLEEKANRVELSPQKVHVDMTPSKRDSKKVSEGWSVYFPQSLYPSKEIHGKVLESQKKHMDKYTFMKQQEAMMAQKALKARQAKENNLPYPPKSNALPK